MLEVLVFLVFPGLVVLAASTDLFTMTIPNKLCLALVASFFIAIPFAGLSMTDVAWHVATSLIALAVTFCLFAGGVFGGGDAKLTAAIALWLGPIATMEFALYAALLGGLLTAALVIMRTASPYGAAIQVGWVQRLLSKEVGIPYGIALSTAAMMVFADSFWMARALAI